MKHGKLFRRALLTLSLLGSLIPAISKAQNDSAYSQARRTLLQTLKSRYVDANFERSVNAFYGKTCDSLLQANNMVEDRSMLVILTRLFTATNDKLNKRA
ncbi:MAG: hypothetical protein EOO06_20205, partial [Chitinophagaceae bacterium]